MVTSCAFPAINKTPRSNSLYLPQLETVAGSCWRTFLIGKWETFGKLGNFHHAVPHHHLYLMPLKTQIHELLHQQQQQQSNKKTVQCFILLSNFDICPTHTFLSLLAQYFVKNANSHNLQLANKASKHKQKKWTFCYSGSCLIRFPLFQRIWVDSEPGTRVDLLNLSKVRKENTNQLKIYVKKNKRKKFLVFWI